MTDNFWRSFCSKKRGVGWLGWIEDTELSWNCAEVAKTVFKLEVSWIWSRVFQGKCVGNHANVQPFFSGSLSLSCRTCFGSLRLVDARICGLEWWWTLEWVQIMTCCWKNHLRNGHWVSELCRHEVSKGTFPNSAACTLCEGLFIPVHIHAHTSCSFFKR